MKLATIIGAVLFTAGSAPAFAFECSITKDRTFDNNGVLAKMGIEHNLPLYEANTEGANNFVVVQKDGSIIANLEQTMTNNDGSIVSGSTKKLKGLTYIEIKGEKDYNVSIEIGTLVVNAKKEIKKQVNASGEVNDMDKLQAGEVRVVGNSYQVVCRAKK